MTPFQLLVLLVAVDFISKVAAEGTRPPAR
jgi:hypothetical protein